MIRLSNAITLVTWALSSLGVPGASAAATTCTHWASDYGATGNGVADDAPAIRKALAAGGTVCLAQGTYLMASYDPGDPTILARFVDNETVVGAGTGPSVIKAANGIFTKPSAAAGGSSIPRAARISSFATSRST